MTVRRGISKRSHEKIARRLWSVYFLINSLSFPFFSYTCFSLPLPNWLQIYWFSYCGWQRRFVVEFSDACLLAERRTSSLQFSSQSQRVRHQSCRKAWHLPQSIDHPLRQLQCSGLSPLQRLNLRPRIILIISHTHIRAQRRWQQVRQPEVTE